jgi:hypothetical protein
MFHGVICGSYLWVDMILLVFLGKGREIYSWYFLGCF